MSRGEQMTDLRHMSDAELARKQNSLVHSEKKYFLFHTPYYSKAGYNRFKKKKWLCPGAAVLHTYWECFLYIPRDLSVWH